MKPACSACSLVLAATSLFGQLNYTPLRKGVHNRETRQMELSQTSEPYFSPAAVYSSGGGANFVELADVNGDGKPDIITGNGCGIGLCNSSYTDNGVLSVLLGNGDGTFQTAVAYDSGGVHAESLAIADVNGDGKPDIVVANLFANGTLTNGSVSVLLGNGDGTFRTAVSYSSGGNGALSTAVADVNKDGNLDILVTNECGNTTCDQPVDGSVGVLLGNGDGTFRPAVTYDSGGAFTTGVAVADVNRDGNPDVVVSNSCGSVGGIDCTAVLIDGSVSILLGNGDGIFRVAVPYDSGGLEAGSVAAADLNGDGNPDVVVTDSCPSSGPCGYGGVMGVLLGIGDGTFQTVVSYESGAQPTSLAVADLNRDGKPDAIVGNVCASETPCSNGQYGGEVSVLLGNGDGSFQSEMTHASGGSWAESVAVADLNGDGKPDIVAANMCIGNDPDTYCPYGTAGVLLQTVAPAYGVAAPASLNFGTVTVGQSSPTKNVALNNKGGSQMTVTSITVSGDFALSNNSCNDGVKPETHCNVYVSFTPTGVGAETGTLTFTDNATNSPQTVALTGTGTNAVATTTTLTSSPEGSDFGQPVVFTATVTSSNGAPPNGEEVAFETRKGALGIGTLSNGSASLTIADLPLGTSKVTAVYGGDATFVGSTSNILEEGVFPAPTATTLDSSVNPSTYGQPVTFTAIVAASGGGIPGGQVNFHDGAFLVHGELEGGVATYTPHKLNVGTTAIIGDYDPDGRKGFIPSSNAVTQVVNQASTTATIFSSLNPSNTGQSLTFTATITGQFGGTVAGKVTFMDGTTVLGTADISRGSAKYTTKKLAAGSHNITATYGGSTDFTGSSASLAQTVN